MDCLIQQMISEEFLWDTSILRNLSSAENLLKNVSVV